MGPTCQLHFVYLKFAVRRNLNCLILFRFLWVVSVIFTDKNLFLRVPSSASFQSGSQHSWTGIQNRTRSQALSNIVSFHYQLYFWNLIDSTVYTLVVIGSWNLFGPNNMSESLPKFCLNSFMFYFQKLEHLYQALQYINNFIIFYKSKAPNPEVQKIHLYWHKSLSQTIIFALSIKINSTYSIL